MNPPPRAQPPIFILVFFALFGCVGIAVLIFIWSSFDAFMGPPLIFRVVGSFIALMFIVMGFGMPLAALKASRNASLHPPTPATADESSAAAKPAGYRCPNCGANLGDQEVSPSGDTKCTYCKRWWNIHRTPA